MSDQLSGAVSEQTPLVAKQQEKPKFHEKPHFQIFGVLLPVGMVVGGVLVLHLIEGWPVLTSLYVLTQIITTVGYGDIVVESHSAKLFMSFYVLSVLVTLAYYLNVFVTKVLDWQSKGIRRYLRDLEDAADTAVAGEDETAKKYGAVNALIAATALFIFVLTFGVVFFRFAEHCTCGYGPQKREGCDDTQGYETCVATRGYVKGWIDAFYLSTVTLSTVGFGDLQPRTVLGRVVGIVWMLVGVGAAANFISALTEYFHDSENEHESNASLVKNISQEQFKQIDRNDTGDLSRGEFLAYMLVTHMGVATDVVDGLLNEFEKIDRKGTNSVTYDMLVQRQKQIAFASDQKKNARRSKSFSESFTSADRLV